MKVSELDVARIKKQLPRKKHILTVTVIPFAEPVHEYPKARPFFPLLY
ncbi:hypothetical protein [Gracilibacillus xinjiangensis]|uniref:Uncharacterized protein n=1 Tax=Gracilibacillus xinjiangensis TaxID=1193282 RepID=A0ABV8WVQ2_9BACI